MISAFIAFTILACQIDPVHEVIADIEWQADAGIGDNEDIYPIEE